LVVSAQDNPVVDIKPQAPIGTVNGRAAADVKIWPSVSTDQSEPRTAQNQESDISAGVGPDRSSATLERSDSQPTRRFWDRVEELLFGWGIGNLGSYPLGALEHGSPTAEQYKILREQIRRIFTESGSHILAVTSPVKGDGKTTVAANLAAAMALDHERPILLIDADLRKPTIHKYFGVASKPGLVDYLTSNSSADVSNYFYKTSMAGLKLFPAGNPTRTSSELLATEKMTQLMKVLPSRFPGHLIVVDTPPILSTSDPLVLAQHVDRFVLIVRAGKTPRACFTEAVKTLGSTKIMGVILNSAELGTASKYYYYSSS
jgi:capsular exopolysaccharide synthesis family protein